MKVRVTFEASELFRRALNAHYGRHEGMATRAEVLTWCEMALSADAETIVSDLDGDDDAGRAALEGK